MFKRKIDFKISPRAAVLTLAVGAIAGLYGFYMGIQTGQLNGRVEVAQEFKKQAGVMLQDNKLLLANNLNSIYPYTSDDLSRFGSSIPQTVSMPGNPFIAIKSELLRRHDLMPHAVDRFADCITGNADKKTEDLFALCEIPRPLRLYGECPANATSDNCNP